MIDACRQGDPPLIEEQPGHLVKCIRSHALASTKPIRLPLPERSADKGDAFLDVAGLTCGYRTHGREVTVVHGIDLRLGTGETVGVVGESGSGKSTLVRAIAGLHQPSAGTVRLAGHELAGRAVERPRDQRRAIQIVFQNADSSLNPRHTVRQILSRPLRLFRDDVQRRDEPGEIAELLDAVALPKVVQQRYPSQLSGGQKQRVAIARAFAARPQLLLCDEVTSALDVSVQATILELIATLSRERGTAVVFVSHDLAVVRTVAQSAVVMRSGRVCEAGPTPRLFERPEHPYTRDLLSALPQLPRSAAG